MGCKLAPFDLTFTARSTIKSQVLAYFMVEWTPTTVTRLWVGPKMSSEARTVIPEWNGAAS